MCEKIKTFIRIETLVLKHRCMDWFDNHIYFWKNVIAFRKNLAEFRPYEYQYSIDMFRRSIELLRDDIAKNSNRNLCAEKSVKGMNELIDLLKVPIEDIPFEELPEDGSNSVIAYNRARLEHLNKVFRIISGPDPKEVEARYKEEYEAYKKANGDFDIADFGEESKILKSVYDGTGIDTWWY